MNLKVKLLSGDAKLPERKTNGSAGYDLYTPISFTLKKGAILTISLEIAVEIPTGYFGRLEDRSSLAVRGMRSLGGTIDEDYRGPLSVILKNVGEAPISIDKGDRIAQLILLPYGSFKTEEVHSLSETLRNAGAYGSTGK